MLLNQVCKQTNLTKKAIYYYIQQGLVSPAISENGYRDFTNQEIKTLEKIAVLRKLNLSIVEIREILTDDSSASLQKVVVKTQLSQKRNQIKADLLKKLSEGTPYNQIAAKLTAIEQGQRITDRLLESFPGYFGRFICLHFARFLDNPIETQAQQDAYQTILQFLDNVPDFDISQELMEYLILGTQHIKTQQIDQMLDTTKSAYENPDAYLRDNKEVMQQYLEYRKSAEYQNSPAGQLMKQIRAFTQSSGYNDVFLPAMRTLSPAYNSYCKQMALANEKLLAQFPEIETLTN